MKNTGFFGRQITLAICLTVLVTGRCYAWDFSGHRLVAEIAWQGLTPKARAQVMHYTSVLDGAYRPTRFALAACWPDEIKIFHDIDTFNHWHYINIPYGKHHGEKPDAHNVVWALEHSKAVLMSQRSNAFDKALFLRFFTHFVGDIHQPLHCFSFYSARFPHGDKGGSLYRIKSNRANNLHQLWDNGGGVFKRYAKRLPLRGRALSQAATQLINEFPRHQFQKALADDNFMHWAQQSFRLARRYSHKTPYAKQPSKAYLQQVQTLAKRQIVIAGYRLAKQLNRIFN